MSPRFAWFRIVAVIALASVVSVPLSAQNTDIEALSGLQFNFGNPGARALGMGGAFLGLADDASAVEANPAGLTILSRTEVSVEARRTSMSQTFGTGGVYPFIADQSFTSNATDIAFASGVIPMKPFAFALYVHRPLQFSNDANLLDEYSTPTFYLGPAGLASRQECAALPSCEEHQIYPYRTRASVELTTFGAAAAWKIGKVSVGAALRNQRFSEKAQTNRVDLDVAGKPEFVVRQENGGRMFGRDHDEAWSVAAGVKWQMAEGLSLGAAWKQGAAFPAPITAARSGSQPQLIDIVDFDVPESMGVGVSWAPVSSFTVNVDVIRIAYSDLASNLVSVIEYGTESPGQIEALQGYAVDDGTELHAGAEYFLPTRVPVALRGGWWRDPAHSITWRGPIQTRHEAAAKILFPERDADDHFTLGVGVSWPKFQIDAAWDHGQRLQTGSVSFVARF